VEEYKAFKNYSEKTAQIIDQKVKDYMNIAYKKSLELVKSNK
jgi:ATP-dependent Zn protease